LAWLHSLLKEEPKELGIRKVMGASAGNLVVMLCGDLPTLFWLVCSLAFPSPGISSVNTCQTMPSTLKSIWVFTW